MKKQNNDYVEQYKNPKWQKLRLKILERDNWACQRCGDDESQLQVHHRCYIHDNKIWEYANTWYKEHIYYKGDINTTSDWLFITNGGGYYKYGTNFFKVVKLTIEEIDSKEKKE